MFIYYCGVGDTMLDYVWCMRNNLYGITLIYYAVGNIDILILRALIYQHYRHLQVNNITI